MSTASAAKALGVSKATLLSWFRDLFPDMVVVAIGGEFSYPPILLG
jgi:hypothetical protein